MTSVKESLAIFYGLIASFTSLRAEDLQTGSLIKMHIDRRTATRYGTACKNHAFGVGWGRRGCSGGSIPGVASPVDDVVSATGIDDIAAGT